MRDLLETDTRMDNVPAASTNPLDFRAEIDGVPRRAAERSRDHFPIVSI
jgi:hypothetical protein